MLLGDPRQRKSILPANVGRVDCAEIADHAGHGGHTPHAGWHSTRWPVPSVKASALGVPSLGNVVHGAAPFGNVFFEEDPETNRFD